MFRGVFHKLLWLLFCLVVSAVGGVVAFYAERYSIVVVCAGALVGSAVLLVRLYFYNTRKITFMFNAIESGDFAFRFPEHEQTSYDRNFNQALNHLRDLSLKTRNDIREQEQYYELILSHVITGIVVIDEKGNVFQTNDEALRLLGMPIFTHIQQLYRVDETLPELFRQLQSGDTQSVTVHTERGTFHLALQVSSVVIRGKALRIVAINDIDRQLDEKELESWIRLTRVLTHEIMNAITPVTSLSETLLQLHGDQDDDIRRGLEVIQTTSQGLIAFVESYRRFTRIPYPEFQLVYVKKMLDRLVLLVSESIRERDIRIEVTVDRDDLMIQADENQISQVILNLLKNALAALDDRPEGWIRINAYCDRNEQVIIELSNNGAPIPPEVAEQIFVPFFTTRPDGSGIGLSISRQIMRLHHGSIKLLYSNQHETVFALRFR